MNKQLIDEFDRKLFQVSSSYLSKTFSRVIFGSPSTKISTIFIEITSNISDLEVTKRGLYMLKE